MSCRRNWAISLVVSPLARGRSISTWSRWAFQVSGLRARACSRVAFAHGPEQGRRRRAISQRELGLALQGSRGVGQDRSLLEQVVEYPVHQGQVAATRGGRGAITHPAGQDPQKVRQGLGRQGQQWQARCFEMPDELVPHGLVLFAGQAVVAKATGHLVGFSDPVGKGRARGAGPLIANGISGWEKRGLHKSSIRKQFALYANTLMSERIGLAYIVY